MNRLTEEAYEEEAIQYQYDLCGNRLEKTDKNGTEVYTYNSKNQLLGRKSNRSNIIYQYDLQGNIQKEIETEGATTYQYNTFN